jgi:RNA polymerase primary sigma factor
VSPEEIDEGLHRFLSLAANHRLLTGQEERDLARAAQRGDERARHRLMEHNYRLVISIARGYRNRGLPFADIVQEGVLGLDRASRKFDPERGFKFSTYATLWIRQAIRRGLSGTGTTIRLPPLVAERRAKARQALLKNPQIPLPELAAILEITTEHLEQALAAAEVVTSLDRESNFDDDYAHTLLDMVTDHDAVDPQEIAEDFQFLREAVTSLPRQQQRVLTLRFGLDGKEPMALAEVAKKMRVSAAVVQAAQRDALKALRAQLY